MYNGYFEKFNAFFDELSAILKDFCSAIIKSIENAPHIDGASQENK